MARTTTQGEAPLPSPLPEHHDGRPVRHYRWSCRRVVLHQRTRKLELEALKSNKLREERTSQRLMMNEHMYA